VPWYLNPVFLPAASGLLGVIVGGFITAVSSYLMEQKRQQWMILMEQRRHEWAISEEKKKRFAEKRLNALQGVIQLCDFVTAAQGQSLGGAAGNDWNRIRSENLANGALLPGILQQQFQAVLRDVLFKDHFNTAELAADIGEIENLRKLCLEAIQREITISRRL